MTKLGRGINELQVDLLQRSSRGVNDHALTEDKGTLLGTSTTALDHDKVFLNLTVVWETTHWGDGLLGDVVRSGSRLWVRTLGNAINLLVHLSSMMVTVLTGTWDTPHNTGWMPSTDTSNLAETLVSLAWKLGSTPTGSDTTETFTVGDTDNIDVLILLNDRGAFNFFFKVSNSPVDFVGDGATVQLDLQKMSLLLTDASLSWKRVGQDTDDGTMGLDTGNLLLDTAGSSLLGVLGESLLLGDGPILVETATDILAQMFSPNGGKGAQTSWSFDVTNETNNNHGWSLDDGDSLDNLFFVELGAWAVKVTHNVTHTSLETDKGGHVDWLCWVIFGKRLALTQDAA